jgi:hypothetical protein
MIQARRREIYIPDNYVSDDIHSKIVKIIDGHVKTDPEAKIHISDTGISYYLTLPEGAERCLVYNQFYRLKHNAKVWKKENIELRKGMYYLIYSPYSKKYFLRQVHDSFNPSKIKRYILDKNLFIINKNLR